MRSDERGMALVEVILLGLVLIVPLVWLLGFLDHVHRAALGATAAARSAGFVAAAAPDPADASQIEQAVAIALEDQELAVDRVELDVSVSNDGGRGDLVHVELRYPVPMLQVPRLGDFPALIVKARHEVVIDPYRSR